MGDTLLAIHVGGPINFQPMELLKIEATRTTPSVFFDPKTGTINLEGRSLPEHAHDFYGQILDWLEDYKGMPAEKTVANINLEYFNSSTSKYLLFIFRKLDELYQLGNSVSLNWIYEADDEDSLDTAEEYNEIIQLDVNFVPLAEEEE